MGEIFWLELGVLSRTVILQCEALDGRRMGQAQQVAVSPGFGCEAFKAAAVTGPIPAASRPEPETHYSLFLLPSNMNADSNHEDQMY